VIWDLTQEKINGVLVVTDFKEFSISFEPALGGWFIWMKSKPGAFRHTWDLRIWPFNIHYRGKRTRDREIMRLRSDLETARAALADYENTISWETTCHGCARLLDRCVEADQRREQAEAELTRIRAALNDMHPWSEIDYWVPCKDHSILDEESTLSACPNCVTEPETGCPRCGDVCDIRAILDPTPETPADASPAPKETDA
jgi:hypothetical protein